MGAKIGTDDYDEVTVGFEDGHTETWTDYDGWVGYTWDDYGEGWVSGWHGPIEYIEATRGDSTMRYTYTGEEDVPEIGCGTLSGWDATDLRMSFGNSHKMYDGPAGDNRTYGSPGRSIESIEEIGAFYIEFDGQGCDTGDRAVEFDCTEVTVYPEEFVNGVEEIWNVRLQFVDGSEERKFDRYGEEMFEPPETFRGTGENEGKVIERLYFDNDAYRDTMFNYSNPDADPSCAEDDEASGEDTEEEGTETEEQDEDGEEEEVDQETEEGESEEEDDEEEELGQPQETEEDEDEEEETETETDSEQTDEETETDPEEQEKDEKEELEEDDEEESDTDGSAETSGTVNETDSETNTSTESSMGGIIVRILRRIQNLF